MDRRKCERSSWKLLVKCPHEIGEHEPREARFEAQGPIVKCDPFCVAAAVPVELSLDLQQASVSDDQNGSICDVAPLIRCRMSALKYCCSCSMLSAGANPTR